MKTSVAVYEFSVERVGERNDVNNTTVIFNEEALVISEPVFGGVKSTKFYIEEIKMIDYSCDGEFTIATNRINKNGGTESFTINYLEEDYSYVSELASLLNSIEL